MIIQASELTRDDLKHMFCSDRRLVAEVVANNRTHSRARVRTSPPPIDAPKHLRNLVLTSLPETSRLAG